MTHDQTEAMTLASRIVVMNEGQIQQVGAPDTIYHRPANQFVASFVGTPGMNLLTGEVHRDGSVRIVDLGGGSRVTVNTPELSARADRLTGRALILGVRPEDVHLERGASGLAVAARVQLVEPMGHENIVHMQVGDGQMLVSRTDNAWSGRAGDQVQAVLDPDRLHIFDPATAMASRV